MREIKKKEPKASVVVGVLVCTIFLILGFYAGTVEMDAYGNIEKISKQQSTVTQSRKFVVTKAEEEQVFVSPTSGTGQYAFHNSGFDDIEAGDVLRLTYTKATKEGDVVWIEIQEIEREPESGKSPRPVY